jgi:hypothetical protein
MPKRPFQRDPATGKILRDSSTHKLKRSVEGNESCCCTGETDPNCGKVVDSECGVCSGWLPGSLPDPYSTEYGPPSTIKFILTGLTPCSPYRPFGDMNEELEYPVYSHIELEGDVSAVNGEYCAPTDSCGRVDAFFEVDGLISKEYLKDIYATTPGEYRENNYLRIEAFWTLDCFDDEPLATDNNYHLFVNISFGNIPIFSGKIPRTSDNMDSYTLTNRFSEEYMLPYEVPSGAGSFYTDATDTLFSACGTYEINFYNDPELTDLVETHEFDVPAFGGTVDVIPCCIPNNVTPEPVPSTYVRARKCTDGTLTDYYKVLGGPVADIIKYNDICLYFDNSLQTSVYIDLITSATEYETCDACLDDSLYYQARNCTDDTLVDLWVTQEFYDEVGVLIFRYGGGCYYFDPLDEPSNTPGTLKDDSPAITFEDCETCYVTCENIGTFLGREVNTFTIITSGITLCEGCRRVDEAADSFQITDAPNLNGPLEFTPLNNWTVDDITVVGNYYNDNGTCDDEAVVPDPFTAIRWELYLQDGAGYLVGFMLGDIGSAIYVFLAEATCTNGIVTIGNNVLECDPNGEQKAYTVGSFFFGDVYVGAMNGSATISY